ncbi:MAG: GDSL family lipase [Nitrospirae bacterium]|nr:GDSL family lipase [Nitrospirota bacterium]
MKRARGIEKKLKRLLFLGDSLIEYFDWSERFPEHEVYNLGIAGETVEGLYCRLAGIFRKVHDPDMVFIMSGINSLAMGDKGIVDTYRKVVQEIRQACPATEIFVQSLLPVLFPFLSNDDICHINTDLRQMAADERVPYLDLHSRFLDEKGEPMPPLLMDDGVHVSEEGYRVWSGEIQKLLSS